LRPQLTSLVPSRPVAVPVVRVVRTGRETSQGKWCFLRSAFAGFTCVRVRMTFGLLRPLPDYPTTPALYPVSVRRIRGYGIGFLQIPPRGGHPCLALRFRSSRPAEDLHLLETQHAWRTTRRTGGSACALTRSLASAMPVGRQCWRESREGVG